MTKWEYRRVFYDVRKSEYYGADNKTYDFEQDMLNELGFEGWELVSVTSGIGGMTATFTLSFAFYFKRPISN